MIVRHLLNLHSVSMELELMNHNGRAAMPNKDSICIILNLIVEVCLAVALSLCRVPALQMRWLRGRLGAQSVHALL